MCGKSCMPSEHILEKIKPNNSLFIGVGRVIFRMKKIEIYRRPATLGLDLIYTILVWTCSL